MKKVLYAASNPTHLQNFHKPYISWLQDHGWQVWVLCAGTPALSGVFRFLDYRFVKSMWSPVNFLTALRLVRLLLRERFDLIYVHTALAAFFVRLAVLIVGKGETRVVNMVHGYLFDEHSGFIKRTLLLAAEKLTADVTDQLLVMNECDLALAQRYRLAKAVALVDGVGVDFTRFQPWDREAAREALALPQDAFLLLYPAEFSKRKNQRFLIRCMKGLPDRVVLILAGSGGARESCQALAKKLGVGERVLFPGQIQDLSPWYAAADLCVSASRYEGLPFNVMEAMYYARPLAVTHVKGHTDLVGDGVNGFLYDFDDAEAYCDCVSKLMDDRELRRIMGEKGHVRVARYGLDRVLPQVLAALGAAEPEPAIAP